jgi:hypothetical protein
MADAGTVTFNLDANSVRLMRELQKAERGSRRSTQKIHRDFEKMGKRVGVAAAAIKTALVLIIRSQAQAIDELAKTADAIGVSTENLQALQHIAKLTGSSAQQLATNMERMQRRLGEVARGGGQAAKALREIGINVDQIASLSADQQLDVLSKALAGVENATIRASIANDLFGRDGVRMLKLTDRLAREGIGGIKREMEALGASISRTEAAGVERMNDALETAQLVSRGLAQRLTITLAPTIAAVAEHFVAVARETRAFGTAGVDATEAVAEGFFLLIDRVVSFVRVMQLLPKLNAALKAAGETATAPFFDDLNTPGRRINKLIELANNVPGIDVEFRFGDVVTGAEDAAREGAAAFRLALDEMHEILMRPLPGEALAERFAKIRADLLAPPAVGTDAPIVPLIDTTKADAALAALREQVAAFNLDDIGKELAKLANIEGITPQMLADAEDMLRWLRDAGLVADAHKKSQEDIAAAMVAAMTPAEKLTAEYTRLNILLDEGLDKKTYARLVIAAQEEFDKATKIAEDHFASLSVFADEAARRVQGAFADFLFDPFEDGLKGMLRSFIETLRRMAAEAASAKILGFVTDAISAFSNTGPLKAGTSFASAAPLPSGFSLTGARADGGPVTAGGTFLVGERGPELFVPNSSGMIVPNGAMGGDIVFQIDARGADAQLTRALPAILEQQAQRIKGDIAESMSRRRGLR